MTEWLTERAMLVNFALAYGLPVVVVLIVAAVGVWTWRRG